MATKVEFPLGQIVPGTWSKILEEVPAPPDAKRKVRYYRALCVRCGKKFIAPAYRIGANRNGGGNKRSSCGCYQRDLRDQFKDSNLRHGHCRKNRQTKFYIIWCRIRACYSQRRSRKYLGDRFAFYEPWEKFEVFAEYLASLPMPEPGQSLQRIDNNRRHEPGNLIWSIPLRLANQRKSAFLIQLSEGSVPLAQACKMFKMSYPKAYTRIVKWGWAPEEALGLKRRLKRPVIRRNSRLIRLENGELAALNDLARLHGLNRQTLADRLDRGWPLEKALNNESGEHFCWIELDEEWLTRPEAAKKCGLTYDTVRQRMERGWSAEEALGRKPRKRWTKK